jgi:ribosomal protein S14
MAMVSSWDKESTVPLQIQFVLDPDTKNPTRKRLLCHDCENGSFLVFHTGMARKAKTPTAHRMRLIARCTKCGKERRIGHLDKA